MRRDPSLVRLNLSFLHLFLAVFVSAAVVTAAGAAAADITLPYYPRHSGTLRGSPRNLYSHTVSVAYLKHPLEHQQGLYKSVAS